MLVRSQCQTCCFANLALVVFGGWGVCWCAVSAKHVVFANLALVVFGGGGGGGALSVSDMLFCQLSPCSVWGEEGGGGGCALSVSDMLFCQLSPCSVWKGGGGVRCQCQTCCFANLALEVGWGGGGGVCAVSVRHVVLPT